MNIQQLAAQAETLEHQAMSILAAELDEAKDNSTGVGDFTKLCAAIYHLNAASVVLNGAKD